MFRITVQSIRGRPTSLSSTEALRYRHTSSLRCCLHGQSVMNGCNKDSPVVSEQPHNYSHLARRNISATAAVSQRRKRPSFEKYHQEGNVPIFGDKSNIIDITSSGLEEPYEHGEDTMDEYLEKTSLSPWVPLPDSACRKIFDLAEASPEDIHVDLGSGDGRVVFHAIDSGGVGQSSGIDVDEHIVQIARDRLARRHPLPTNIAFFVADLFDENHPSWQHVQEATLITMFFADEGLAQLRPILEKKLMGRQCKVVTCGYSMPGWNSSIEEVVLGTPLFLYEWGTSLDDDEDDEDGIILDEDDELIRNKPGALLSDPLQHDKFSGSKVTERTGKHPIRGYDPDVNDHYKDGDDWTEDSDSDDEGDSGPAKEEVAGVDARESAAKRTASKCDKN